MAQKEEIIINCGNSHVSANVFVFSDNQLILKASGLETLHHDLTSEEMWLDSLVDGLAKLIAKLSIKGDVRFIFPGNLLLTKTIRVPHVDKEKQRKIVAFELSQKMPFPLSDLIWDYQIIDDDGVEDEVLAFAVKPEVAENFCEKMVNLGLIPIQITPAQVLDYNAIKGSLGEENDNSEILAINIGAKSTNLLFINPSGFLIRTLSIGGNSLTQNISDSLGISFEKAENLKKSYYSQEIALAEDDPSLNVIQNGSSQFLARASQEITRSIVTYKRLKKGKLPQKILLTGRGVLLSNLAQYLIESQQLQVEYFDPLKSVQFGKNVPDEIKPLLPFMISEAVGLARSVYLGSSENLPTTINLLPSSKLKSLGFKQKLPVLTVALLILSLLPLPFYLKNNETLSDLKIVRDKLKKQVIDTEEEINGLIILQNKLLFSQQLISHVSDMHSPFHNKLDTCWLSQEIINYIQGILESEDIGDIWLDTFDLSLFDSPKSTVIKNETHQYYQLVISGRYLVRVNEEADADADNLQDSLIEMDRIKKESLTAYLEKIPYIKEISRKTFSIEGKGDLFKRKFSHFEYELLLQIK